MIVHVSDIGSVVVTIDGHSVNLSTWIALVEIRLTALGQDFNSVVNLPAKIVSK